MAALDPVVLLAGADALAADAGDGEPSVMGADVEILTAHAGDLRGDHVVVDRFVQIDSGLPAGRGGSETVQTLLDGEQVANGIPADKRHEGDPSRPEGQGPRPKGQLRPEKP